MEEKVCACGREGIRDSHMYSHGDREGDGELGKRVRSQGSGAKEGGDVQWLR